MKERTMELQEPLLNRHRYRIILILLKLFINRAFQNSLNPIYDIIKEITPALN